MKTRKTAETIWLDCQCHDVNHAVQVVLEKGEDPLLDDPELHLRVVVNYSSLWQRIKRAFRYVFFGEKIFLNEVLLTEDSVVRIAKAVFAYRTLMELRRSKRKKLREKGHLKT